MDDFVLVYGDTIMVWCCRAMYVRLVTHFCLHRIVLVKTFLLARMDR
jgi:hypothetical protein